MSQRSLLSPMGKRLRTMSFSGETTDDDEELTMEYYVQHGSGRELLQANAQDQANVGNIRPDHNDASNLGNIPDSDDSSIERILDGTDGDDDDYDIDSHYSRDSLSSSSGYAGLNDEDREFLEQMETEDDDDDDSIDNDSEEEEEIDNCSADVYLKHDPTPDTQYPKPEWITINELRLRRYGFSSARQTRRTNMFWFEKYVNRSLWMIQKLEVCKRLEEHSGSVNCLDFNSSGNLLCSGSDDLSVCVWDWQREKLRTKINTRHSSNVFHAQFCNSEANIITSSRDGSVRLLNVETSQSELLLSQSGEIGKLAFLTPQTLVTCGTNACVNFLDLRIRQPTKLFIVRNPKNARSCALHSIDSHPLDKHKIVVAGSSPYVFLYDLRRIARNPNDIEHKPTCCLDKFENTYNIVTSTAFNSTGDKILLSYNDDDLFVCQTDTCEIIHSYKGHRNKKTIKGCAWFSDNFVLSGSDDGHIYGWDLESEHIVCFIEGDLRGVVNCLSVHPNMPILASSGLDHDIKISEPMSKTWPRTMKGIKPQICRNTMHRKRAQERRRIFHAIEEGESDTNL